MMNEEVKSRKPEKKRRDAGQIIKRGDDKYLLRIFLCKDSEGKRHFHNETFHGKKRDAETRVRELLTRHEKGEPLKLNNDSLNTFLDEFLDSRPSLKESSRRHYTRMLDYYVRPKLGGKLLATIQASDIQALYRILEETTKLGKGTIKLVHTLLGMAFKLAVKRRKLSFDPMIGVDSPSGKAATAEAVQRRGSRVMSAEQIGDFLKAADDTRFGSLFSLAFFTGCRPGELLALKWSDFDAGARTLYIRQTINWLPGAEWYLDTPKTAKGRRVLRLTDDQIDSLNGHRKRQLEERLKAGRAWNDHDFIFADQIGEPYSQTRIRYFFKQILKAAGLPEQFNPFSARHTAATLLMGDGVNPKTVSERMGHANINITLSAYTHPTDVMHEAASERMTLLIKASK